MDERTRFVLARERGLHTMTELCEMYEITRETGYYGCGGTSWEGWKRCRIGTGRPSDTPTRRRRKSKKQCSSCGGRT